MDNLEEEILLLFKTWTNASDERSFLLKLSTFWKIIIWIFVMLSLIIGCVAKVFMYNHFIDSSFKETPINVFILIEQIIHHFCGTFVLTNFLISLQLDISLEYIINENLSEFIGGRSYCRIFIVVQVWNLVYRGVGGLVIAIIRIIYTRKGDFQIGFFHKYCYYNANLM